jgi:2-keto-4-pentenoate hydratase/2-oxohepta-3-ene-1,7-dioic acid hydratase in catechol pathway
VKIVRFLTEDGRLLYGVVHGQGDNEAKTIEGDIFSRFEITNKVEKIGRILAPVDPPNIIALGLNYGKHAEETGIRKPEVPVIFLKGTNSITAHGSDIILPKAGPDQVDFEAELAVVIGRDAKNVPPEEVGNYIFGYTCANDVSARDWQIHKQKKQWARGKSFDTFCPLGPCLVTRDEIEDPDDLPIKAILNGKIMQDASTADMLFSIRAIISDISRSMTLRKGTIIMTGTPDGVGFTREPPLFLREGDTIDVEIEKVGKLSNTVTREE